MSTRHHEGLTGIDVAATGGAGIAGRTKNAVEALSSSSWLAAGHVITRVAASSSSSSAMYPSERTNAVYSLKSRETACRRLCDVDSGNAADDSGWRSK
ncbi:hypothetical protein [Polyangium sp. 15x6]|uniref:hypothetical protein n=1 Tax=Polyangium sp. 15x6 TaxID=3042687 RepID=UPI00249BEDFB|nr:hypothetical protein [Polyangium sp. 15x6]MDI3284709.1 hypothetical protein [Polyangium sp. 15x6]